MFVLLSYDFTPLDSSAVYVLSSMARRRRASQSSGGAVSPDRDTSHGTVLQSSHTLSTIYCVTQKMQFTGCISLRNACQSCVCSQPADSPGPSHSTRHAPTESQHASTAGGNNATPTKCKRPMNAFMLFAKKFRVEYTQMYPGKDNRWVGSVPTCAL